MQATLAIDLKDSAAQDYCAALSFLGETLAHGWRTNDWIDRPLRWRFFEPMDSESPAHGWKIHVSASAAESARLLRELAALLAWLRMPFKVLRHLEDVVLLNSGDAGGEQLGKVLTVYPPNVERARAAMTALDAAWPLSRGPEVITDWQLRAGAAVSFRYGVYRATDEVVDSVGVHHFGWRSADGLLVADTRAAVNEVGIGTPAPPLSGAAPQAPPVSLNQVLRLAGADYLPLARLAQTPRAATWLAVDLDSLHTVVIKAGRRGAAGDANGFDVCDLMRNEFAALRSLQHLPGLVPAPLAFVDEGQPVLIMADFRGDLMCELPRAERVAALPMLAEAVAQLHAIGMVHGDVKPENAVRYPGGVGLIDFEFAARIGAPMRSGGTPGYLDPAVRGRTLPATIARDVFALGGCVVQALLDTPPGLLPPGRAGPLLRNEGLHDAARCMQYWQAAEASLRPDAAAVAQTLRACVNDWRAANTGKPAASDTFLRWCRRAAGEAAHATVAVLQPRAAGACWRNEHFMRAHDCEGINLGAAGIVLGLLAIGQALARPDFDGAIAAGATWLASRGADGKAAGPFTGNAGVALALAASGQRFGEESFVCAARGRFEAAARDRREVDLFSGVAGVVWTAVLLRDLLRDDWPLELAADALAHLRTLKSEVDGIPVWTAVPSRDTMYFGCAHGSAGIALASWGRATGDATAIEEACETWSAIALRARTDSGHALRIGPGTQRHHAVGNWCHGVAGYLWTILNGIGDHPELRGEIDWAVDALTRAPSAGTPTLCHGLAGHLELWQMLQAVPRFAALARSRARKVAHALRCLHVKVDGRCVWTSDDPAIITPDLWIGFLGPASALARHAAGVRDALLSSPGLARIASPHVPRPEIRPVSASSVCRSARTMITIAG